MDIVVKEVLEVSILESQLTDQATSSKTQLVCFLLLNDENIDSFVLNNPSSPAILPIKKGSDKIGIILKKKDSNQIVGCISFQVNMFYPLKEKTILQWATLFDSPDDDEFDGDIGVDDDEAPRIQIKFAFKPETLMNTPEDSKFLVDLASENKDQFLPNGFSISQSSVSNARSLSIQEDENIDKGLLFENPLKEEKVKEKEVWPAIPTLNPFNRSPVRESRSPSQNNSKSKSPNKRKESNQQLEKNEQIQTQQKAEPELETKIIELINILKLQQQSDNSNHLLSKIGEPRSHKNDVEKDYLFQLEIEKNKILEATLNQAETQLSKVDNLYKELEKKSQEQLKNFIENSKTLNKENYDLKRKIAELETQRSFQKEGHVSQRSKVDFEAKIEQLERVNTFLKEQLEKSNSSLQEEKGLNHQLQAELSRVLTQDNIRNSNTVMVQNEQLKFELKELTKTKNELDKSNSLKKSEIEKLELRCQSLETDVEISQQETKRLIQEVEEYKKLGASFRKVVDELTKQKDKEIIDLKEQAERLNEQIILLQEENDLLLNSKNQFEQYVNFIRSMEYEKKNQLLESVVNQLEEEKRKLQEQLASGKRERLSPSPAKIFNNEKSELKSQEGSSSDQSKLCDQLRLEINEMKLKLYETEDYKDKHQSLKQRLKVVQEENEILRENQKLTQKRLFATAAELVKQTSITLEQNNIIANLNQQMQILDESLKTAFDNISKLQTSVQSQRRTTDLSQSRNQSFQEFTRKNDIDFMLNEFLSQNVIPNKFTRVGDGIYVFGSKKLHLKTVNDKLVVQMNGGVVYFDEFIRLFAHQELLKIKTGKTYCHYTNMEEEEIPQEAKSNKVIWDVDHEQPQYHSKRARTEITQLCSTDSGAVSRSGKKEQPLPSGSYIMSESSQQDSTDHEFIVYDITPQMGRDQTAYQSNLKRNSRGRVAEKVADPYTLFTNNLRNYENENRRGNTKSHDPYKGSSSKLNIKKMNV